MAWTDFFRPRGDGRAEPVAPTAYVPLVDSPPPGRKRLAAIVGTGAVAGLIAVVAQWEGKRNDPYADHLARGILTVCYGDTEVEMRRYSDAECKDLLANRLGDYAAPVLARNPELRGHDPQLIAATSLAYNIGTAAYNRSTVARHFSAGRWRQACDAFLMWTRAGGREIPGLRKRREKERAICLRGLR